ncbi:MAG: aminotransferase class V-fold PLP-dependent enzyme, partial [Candidatus Latescibacteria bacterium]|nr:aminotransferase class V-fold PLP-dependent enzyme [bacterium]MBD3424058.1 aminotransferase class V-fold PLP-dependent enzyme [Candidatus Latescibacterota bacterium]
MNDERKAVVLTPGPVHLHSSVLEAVEPLHHRTGRFREMVKDVEHSLQELLGTANPVYMVTSSGTGVMEAAIANVTSPGTRVLVIAGGKFGMRWEELGRVYRCTVETVSFRPGAHFDIEVIMDRVRSFRPEVIAVTHVESSTGTLFPLKEFADALPREKPLLVVDAIASLGVEDLEMDRWGIDLVISAGQKALAAPPGISFICMNQKARERSEDCGRPLYYFSAGRYEAGCEKGDTPFT